MISTPLTEMTNSGTMMTNELVKTLRGQGKDVIALGFGQSPFPPPPRLVSKLQEAAHRHEYLRRHTIVPQKYLLLSKIHNMADHPALKTSEF